MKKYICFTIALLALYLGCRGNNDVTLEPDTIYNTEQVFTTNVVMVSNNYYYTNSYYFTNSYYSSNTEALFVMVPLYGNYPRYASGQEFVISNTAFFNHTNTNEAYDYRVYAYRTNGGGAPDHRGWELVGVPTWTFSDRCHLFSPTLTNSTYSLAVIIKTKLN